MGGMWLYFFCKRYGPSDSNSNGVLKNGILSVQAGAGIVYDSIPENEWRETEAKAGAVIKAAESLENNKSSSNSKYEDISHR